MFTLPFVLLLALLGQSYAGPPPHAASRACKSNTWLNLTSIPNARQEHGTVALSNTTIAVIGGIDTSRTDGFFSTDLLQIYNISSNTWHNAAPTPFKVNHPNVAVVAGKLYLLGGLTDGLLTPDLLLNWTTTSQSSVYDPNTDTWSALTPMPPGTERGSAIAGVHGETIYLAGGMSVLDGTYQDSLTMVTAYNTTSGAWQRGPPPAANIPEGRQHTVGSVIGDTFYVVGGRWFSQTNVRGTVFELDLANQTAGWRTSPGQLQHPRGGLAGGTVGNEVYTFGGEGDPDTVTGVFPQSEAFDSSKQEVYELRAMTVPRHGMAAVAVGNKVYVPGGGLQQDGKPVNLTGTVTLANPSNHFDAYCV